MPSILPTSMQIHGQSNKVAEQLVKHAQQKTQQGEPNDFSTFIKNDAKNLMKTAQQSESMLHNYFQGIGSLEEIAPVIKQVMTEIEIRSKMVSSFAGILKTLTSMQI